MVRMIRQKGLNGVKRPREKLIKGHLLEGGRVILDPKEVPFFLKGLEHITNEAADLVYERHEIRPDVSIYFLDNEQATNIDGIIDNDIENPELFYGKKIYLNTDIISYNHSRTAVSLIGKDVGFVKVSKKGHKALFQTYRTENVAINVTDKIYGLANLCGLR